MREICMSGSTRGQWVAAGRRSLSYSTVHLRPDMLCSRPDAKIKTRYWPQMNADKRG
jgi:hypothetical protein